MRGVEIHRRPDPVGIEPGRSQGARSLAVVGTPCQMTAVAQMRMNPLNREDFEDPGGLDHRAFLQLGPGSPATGGLSVEADGHQRDYRHGHPSPAGRGAGGENSRWRGTLPAQRDPEADSPHLLHLPGHDRGVVRRVGGHV